MINNEVYNYVLKRLEPIFPYIDMIPKITTSDYVIAGGSISNIIYEYFTGIPAVINDIDIFYTHGERAKNINYEKIRKNYGESNFTTDLCIFDTHRFGILNLIETNNIFENDIYNPYEELIISHFDLNCVQVGLTNYGLVYTKNFLNFLQTKELKITNIIHYFGGICRIFKKMKHLKVDVDIENLMFILSQFLYFYSDSHWREFLCKTLMREEFYEKKVEPIKDKLEKYFFMPLINDYDDGLKYTIFPKLDVDQEFQRQLKPFDSLPAVEIMTREDLPYATEYKKFFERSERVNFYPIWARM